MNLVKLLIYFAFINILSILNCMIDKENAKKRKARISEKRLFIMSVLGGSIGMYFTMLIIRHKTRHKRFMIGLPVIILLQAAVCLILLRQYG